MATKDRYRLEINQRQEINYFNKSGKNSLLGKKKASHVLFFSLALGAIILFQVLFKNTNRPPGGERATSQLFYYSQQLGFITKDPKCK